MATSGSVNFSQTRNEVILDALSLIGVNSIGRAPSAEDVSVCSRILNKMVKAWQARGLHLWTKEEGILFLTPYQGEYSLGSANLATAAWTDASDVTTTMLTANITVGQTNLPVETTAGMTINDHIGIVKDDGYLVWTTISAIPDSTHVTIIAPGATANISQSQLVYTFTKFANKPLRILDARVIQGINRGPLGTNQVETPLTIIPYQNYYGVGMVTAASTLPNQCAFNPKDLTSKLMIWPVPLRADHRIQITYERQIEDLDNIADDFDFPSEWLEPLTYQLAIRVASIFGKEGKAQFLAPMASQMLENLLDWDAEITSITFQPYYDGSGYSSYDGGEGWGR